MWECVSVAISGCGCACWVCVFEVDLSGVDVAILFDELDAGVCSFDAPDASVRPSPPPP